ncbi:hypothetical protein TBLA_0B01020 [Henningerozyma blattae CBS 6284]|uniref:Protein NSG2 n=1 Tax=Henningerozyma blattae (strain ATCC 34711 / CBS 6284 / DSM 70876 / NBRC 10599 / NRRL Y-10934 / UCD 77-7) TaxID=1071380 RepID=I2GXU3_HENB6|nr:hypothetical protein TBLA_0B01020 [Tetrapisispora blattae CBS 6284]CCH58945.1 hypothetical protein TBLA_0B01020 [Tetrapisispora blattae CBS 6284]
MKDTNLSKTNYTQQSRDSINNLTKPTLYSIYDDDITKTASNDLYDTINMKSNKNSLFGDAPSSSSTSLLINSSSHNLHASTTDQLWNSFLKLLILSIFGILYHELSIQLYDNHDLKSGLTSKPLNLGVTLAQSLTLGIIPKWVSYGFEGIFFGLLIPCIDTLFHIKIKKHTYSNTSILKSCNVLLGVTYGIRKLEWSSSLQASGAWALLNIILWLFFDGTISMFLSCGVIGICCSTVCWILMDWKSEFGQLLYFVDFYFLGLLLFGQLGRYLFKA